MITEESIYLDCNLPFISIVYDSVNSTNFVVRLLAAIRFNTTAFHDLSSSFKRFCGGFSDNLTFGDLGLNNIAFDHCEYLLKLCGFLPDETIFNIFGFNAEMYRSYYIVKYF
jgi:hypothetical protein